MISYSPLSIPIANGKRSLTLARRDLFDARFQLISSDEPGNGDADVDETKNTVSKDSAAGPVEDALSFLDAPSDLVPGVYEGGLKTWECSLDLVDCLDEILSGETQNLRGKRILEVRFVLRPLFVQRLKCNHHKSIQVGCGTAVPSIYLLSQLFSSSEEGQNFEIHLQDYNDLVLRLVTLPNVILTWCPSFR